ncbi:MAG: FAD-binding protein, partial [Candidatus Sumerlaeia bacterium]|nr:FAD-binding protein [Candidatus Sumerlaeia bacterium]
RKIKVFKANAVILCTGGPGLVFGKSTNSMINTGAAAARAYQQGVHYGNGEFIQVHPTAIPGADKLRLISESVRGEGGRVWVPKKEGDKRRPTDIPDSERDYFLERKYPKYGNLVPRDVATREIFHVCVMEKRGVDGRNQVYLDITPEKSGQKAEILERKLGGVFEIYRKFIGDDPIKTPMKIFPGMHYSMGGVWVGYEDKGDMVSQMTNIPGTFAAGEADFQYHGANRLGANSLLSCIFGGLLSGERATEWVKSNSDEADETVYSKELKRVEDFQSKILSMTSGKENGYALHRELGDAMTAYCTVVRDNKLLDGLLEKLNELEERWDHININDTTTPVNQSASHTWAFWDMIQLAKAIAKGARLRDESRGAHYKPEFDLQKPEKEKLGEAKDHDGYRAYCKELSDKWGAKYDLPEKTEQVSPEFEDYMTKWIDIQKNWLKSTIATYVPGEKEPKITYREVATTVEPPRPRIYK